MLGRDKILPRRGSVAGTRTPVSPAAWHNFWRERRSEVPCALISGLLSSLAAGYALRLWNADLRIPFSPNHDGSLLLMEVKGVLEHGWVLSNPDLGAPFGQDLHDFAVSSDSLHLIAVKLLGLFSSNPAAVINIYFLLTFPLVGLSAYVVMRWLGISRGASIACSVLYAVAPYHFRYEQSFLFAYYTVPIAACFVAAVYLGAPLFERRTGEARGPLRFASRRSLFTLALCVLVGLSGIYFVAFAVILLVAAGAISFVASRSRTALLSSAAVATALVVVTAAAATPELLYRAEHGKNRVVAVRFPNESELYSLNFTQLVMPVAGHRLGHANNLRDRWLASSPVDKEPVQLGLVAALGFVWLLGLALAVCVGAAGRLTGDARQRGLAAASVTALLVGTTGGISALIAYTVSPQLRGWTRIAIFIAFFSLAAVGLLLDAGRRELRRRGVRRDRPVFAALLAGVVVIGILDQTGSAFVPPYSASAASYRSDATFVRQIEGSVPRAALIFQLPYVPFPESPPVERMLDYDLLRPYLHSRELRWSYGAMKGRPQNWQAELDGAPPSELLPAVSAAGFAGIYVDRFGYVDAAAKQLEGELGRVLGVRPLTSSDGRLSFFDMGAYNRKLRGSHPAGELRALADATLSPLRADWGSAFSQPEREGLEPARWTVEQRASLGIVNPSAQERAATLVVRLMRPGGGAAPVDLTYPDGSVQRVQATPTGILVRRGLRFPPGSSAIQISTAGFPVQDPSSAGDVGGFVRLMGFRLIPDSAFSNG